MSWIQVQVNTSAEHVDILEGILLELGACSITYSDGSDQPLYEPEPGEVSLWDHTRLTGLFAADYPTENISEALTGGMESLYESYKIEVLEDKDWEKEWIKHFKPISFGKRLWICPSWIAPPEPSAINLMLDPGLAFGTGSHSTTALCLSWLDGHDIEGKCVLDYGCGSGVLAIAAGLLGASQIIGVDIDSQALQSTRDNAIRNNINEDKLICCFPDECPDVSADIIVANILASPLKKLAAKLAEYTVIDGTIILSGILDSQIEEITQCYKPYFDIKQPVVNDGWVLLEGVRNANH